MHAKRTRQYFLAKNIYLLLQSTDSLDGKCSTCKKKISIRQGNWFEKSHLSLYQIILLTYCWAHDLSQSDISREVDCN